MSDPTFESKGLPRSKPGATARRLPDPDFCRAKHTGFADHVNCITPHQWSCEFAVPFGLGYLCLHADRFGIASRTPGEKPPGK